jgi:hypothetical protein
VAGSQCCIYAANGDVRSAPPPLVQRRMNGENLREDWRVGVLRSSPAAWANKQGWKSHRLFYIQVFVVMMIPTRGAVACVHEYGVRWSMSSALPRLGLVLLHLLLLLDVVKSEWAAPLVIHGL